MVSILNCESNFVHYKSDGNVLRGRVTPADSGVAQINKDFHEREAVQLGYDLDDIRGNLAYARTLYDREGSDPWVCKRHISQR